LNVLLRRGQNITEGLRGSDMVAALADFFFPNFDNFFDTRYWTQLLVTAFGCETIATALSAITL